MDEISLSSEDIRLLGIYKNIAEQKPVSLTLEDMAGLPKLADEIKQLETDAEPTFQEIENLKAEIKERMDKIVELYGQIDPKLRYLRDIEVSHPVQSAPVQSEGNGITKEKILEVLRSGAKGNADIAKELGLTGSKQDQNKIYGLCKTLESEGKIISQNRKWSIK